MEPQLKQRLVGAAVLVSLAILIVPVLLDGGYREAAAPRRDMAPMPQDQFEDVVPPLPPDVQQSLDRGIEATPEALSASAQQSASSLDVPPPVEDYTPPPDVPPVAELAPAAPPVAPATPAPAPPPVARPAAPASVAAAPPAAAPPRAEQWTVQLGSFASRANAESLLGRVKATGVDGFILPLTEQGKTSFRVRAGPVAGRAAADRLRQDLERTQAIRGMLVRYP